jgi:hypothetical protein
MKPEGAITTTRKWNDGVPPALPSVGGNQFKQFFERSGLELTGVIVAIITNASLIETNERHCHGEDAFSAPDEFLFLQRK